MKGNRTLSTQPENHNKKRLPPVSRLDAQIVVTAAAVALAALALFIAVQNERRVKLQVGEDVSVQDAESILSRANEVAGFANSILSFLEGASVVVGAGLAVGAWMLRNSIQKQIDATNDFVREARQEFARREESLMRLEAELAERLDAMVMQSKQDIADVEDEARDSFRVLSLLVLAEQQVRAHNIDTAIRTLQTAYEMVPNNQATNYLLGYLYASRKQFDLAIERLEHALRLEPDFTPAIAALGLAMRRKGDSLSAPEQRTERAALWAQAESKLLEALRKDQRLTDADGES
jgi:tetratricopeptide (TPR) repeat protein